MKQLACAVASVSGLNALARSRNRMCARVLAYHGVDENVGRPENFDGFQVHPSTFEGHLRMLARHFRVVPLAEITCALAERRPLPEQGVAITFDDGYANNLAVAAPLLRKYAMPATFFVTSGFIDGKVRPWWYRARTILAARGEGAESMIRAESVLKDLPGDECAARLASLVAPTGVADGALPYRFMGWPEVRFLSDMGFEIGAHTVTHVSLARERADRVEQEIRGSMAALAACTGRPVEHLAYPYGRLADIDDRVKRIVRELGLHGALTTVERMVEGTADRYALPRFNVTGRHTPEVLESLLSGLAAR